MMARDGATEIQHATAEKQNKKWEVLFILPRSFAGFALLWYSLVAKSISSKIMLTFELSTTVWNGTTKVQNFN